MRIKQALKQVREASSIKRLRFSDFLILSEKPLWRAGNPRKPLGIRENRIHPFLEGVCSNSLTQSFLLPPMHSNSSSHVVSCLAFQLDKFSVCPYPQTSISSLSKRCGFSINKTVQSGSTSFARSPVSRTPLAGVLAKSTPSQRHRRRIEAKVLPSYSKPHHHLYNTRSMPSPSLSQSSPEVIQNTVSQFQFSVSPESSRDDDSSDEPLKSALLSLRGDQPSPIKEETFHSIHRDRHSFPVDMDLLEDVRTPPMDHNEICMDEGLEVSADVIPFSTVPCNCKKSRCLKLYCECFAADRYCHGCHCQSCMNTPVGKLLLVDSRNISISGKKLEP